jgi:hypothetical protein
MYYNNENVILKLRVVKLKKLKIRGSAVGIVTGYGLDDRVVRVRNFKILQMVQTGTGVHIASSPICTGGSFPPPPNKAAGVVS